MKTTHRWLVAILCFAMLVLLVSCANVRYIPKDGTVGNMSVEQARKTLVTGLRATEVRVTSDRLIITYGDKNSVFIILSENPDISGEGRYDMQHSTWDNFAGYHDYARPLRQIFI